MPSIKISLDHEDARILHLGDAAEPCCVDIELDLAYEPGESNYGADADGNRGISIPGGFYVEDEIPTKCSECGHEYTMEELGDLRKQADEKAASYEVEPDYLEPDYDEDRWHPPLNLGDIL